MFIPANARLLRARSSQALRRLIVLGAVALSCVGAPAQTPNAERTTVVVVVGAPGEEEYGRNFSEWTGALSKAAGKAGAKQVIIGLQTNNTAADREQLQQALTAEPKDGTAELWLVLIGHGTFDGRDAKFNLRSNDVAATELADWLKPFHRPLAVINTASASAPFLQKLSATNHVVLTATRSGSEVNYARFGQYFSAAVGDLEGLEVGEPTRAPVRDPAGDRGILLGPG
jgi:mannose-6-phosphate isomerase-like protein (cupin superfamily)